MNGPHPGTRSAMGSGRGLAEVIMEMQDEIKKLESENRALRGELGQHEAGSGSAEANLASPAFHHRHAAEESSPHANLRRNASAPTLERQYKDNIIMTVRRYSISPDMRTVNRKSERLASGQEPTEARDTGWTRLQGETRGDAPALLAPSAREESREKQSNRRSLQEYVHKSRAKVKTVTFLLPVEDIYTNRPFLANQRAGGKTYDLGVIVEDS
ncbi:uncharacterized protein LOC133108689 [Conger conger]|uniref:uncharacterized protein LOC133108689 n=1 Tax=Conger conger TaxID=82655 RepID=UPI002A5ACEF1|nr:uncharacterized protein LOC133108689 [Conger conger]